MHARVATLVLILACLQRVYSFDSKNLVFVIVSQNDPYLADVAMKLRQDLEDQVLRMEGIEPTIHLTHKDFPIPGAWTIAPLFGHLVNKYKGKDVRWIVFIEPHTVVRYDKLVKTLAAADGEINTMWIGYPLSDHEPTIIHHFAMFEELEEEGGLNYPNFASGFVMRLQLMETVLKQIQNGERNLEEKFSIDPSFELAKLIYGDGSNPGPQLSDDLSFCIAAGDNCATYPKPFEICGTPIPEKTIYFAVKTWSGFHNTRARVVKKTWGQHVSNLVFYSDTMDPSLPSIDTGVRNSRRGHCVKTMTILKMAVVAVKKKPHIKWIFLADDDTILGVQRLTEVLSCYGGGDAFTLLGERYGYGFDASSGLKSGNGNSLKGYDYITLGGGAAVSIRAAALLSKCRCRSNSAADDMTLGECVQRLNLTVTHSPLFHQNRPQDYPRELLSWDRPVSFHRHSSPAPQEPFKVYVTWFQHDDLAIRQRKKDEL